MTRVGERARRMKKTQRLAQIYSKNPPKAYTLFSQPLAASVGPDQPFFRMSRNRRILSILFALVVTPLMVESHGKNCGGFGHGCFGGYGKRAEIGLDDRDSTLPLDPIDYKTLQMFRQLCTLPPDQHLRMVSIFRRLAETYNKAAEESSTRK